MGNEDLRKKTISGVVFKTIERLMIEGVSLIISIILARLLLPEQYGNVALIIVFVTLFDVVIDYGLGVALIQKKDSDAVDFATCLYTSIILAVIFYLFLFFFSTVIADFYNEPKLAPMLKLLSLQIIFSSIKSIQTAYVAKHFMFSRSMIAVLIATIISGVIGIILAYNNYGEWSLIVQRLLSSVINVIILAFIIPYRPILAFSLSKLKGLLRFSWKLLVMGLFNSLYTEIRSLAIGKKYSSEDLAYYDKGNNFPKLITNNVNSVIDGVLFSSMSVLQDDKNKLVSLNARSIKTSIFCLSPCLLGLFCVSNEFITLLFTEKWIFAAEYLRIICIAYLSMPMVTLTMNAIKSQGKSGVVLKIDIVCKVIGFSLLMGALFISVKYVAYSLVVSNLIMTVIYMIASSRCLGYKFLTQTKDFIFGLLPGLIMFIVLNVFGMFVHLNIVLSLILKVVIGVVVFLLSSVILKNESLKYLFNVVRKRKVN